ncbi:MAG: hypothetical protein PHT60_14395, partial [Acidiphilium sp.]|nr:hypothetical protein [Acidiphilium sp.]MDD4936951.1 hypothetical protein [Acidiphilium sp.]
SVISVSHTSRRAFNLHNELIAALGRPHGIIINEVESLYYRDDHPRLGSGARDGKGSVDRFPGAIT